MKKVLVLISALSVLAAGSAMARPGSSHGDYCNGGPRHMQQVGFQGENVGGGFSGPASNATITTVEQAKAMADDTRVALRGNIIQSLGGGDYVFKDDSGTITVDIDHKRWRGMTVTPTDKVEIYGKVDKDSKSVEIDVKHIIKLAPAQ